MTVYNRGGCKFFFQLWCIYIYLLAFATCLGFPYNVLTIYFFAFLYSLFFQMVDMDEVCFVVPWLPQESRYLLFSQRTIRFTYKHNMSSSSSTQQVAMVAMEWVDTEVTGDMWVCAQAKSFWNLPDVCCALFRKEEILFGNKFMWCFLFVSIAVPSKYLGWWWWRSKNILSSELCLFSLFGGFNMSGWVGLTFARPNMCTGFFSYFLHLFLVRPWWIWCKCTARSILCCTRPITSNVLNILCLDAIFIGIRGLRKRICECR